MIDWTLDGPLATLTLDRAAARNAIPVAGWHRLAAIASEMATGELVQLLPGAEFKQVSYIFLSGVRRQEDSRLNAIIEFLQQAVPTFQI